MKVKLKKLPIGVKVIYCFTTKGTKGLCGTVRFKRMILDILKIM